VKLLRRPAPHLEEVLEFCEKDTVDSEHFSFGTIDSPGSLSQQQSISNARDPAVVL
jgi:hypothetical protein